LENTRRSNEAPAVSGAQGKGRLEELEERIERLEAAVKQMKQAIKK
jgi:uncharacterized protein (UPF0335 family)